jgi:hypothetical protein
MAQDYFHKYLAQNSVYTRQTKADIVYVPLALHGGCFRAIWLGFDPADTKNLEVSDDRVYSKATFTNISLNTRPTRAKPKLI